MKRVRGFSLVEMLVALAVCAALLAAMAMAFTAAAQGVRGSAARQGAADEARATLAKLLRDARTGVACQVGEDAQQGQAKVTAPRLRVVGVDGATRDYRWSSGTRRLTVTVGTRTSTLAENVTACSFAGDLATDASTGARLTQSVAVTLTLTAADGRAHAASGSVRPRCAAR